MGGFVQPFLSEILQQPDALRTLITSFDDTTYTSLRKILLKAHSLLFTGMGASFHAGEIAAYRFQSAQSVRVCQAIEMLNYPPVSFDSDTVVIYISQSGNSGEVKPVLDQFDKRYRVIALTNDLLSVLGRRADVALALQAGSETTVATKTYLNTLAVLNLMAGVPHPDLLAIADKIANMHAHADQTAALWLDLFSRCKNLYFLGHGAHSVTARHVSMMLAEWCKRPSVAMSIGAFRHGFIETIDAESGVVIFAPSGNTSDSALALADELTRYGAHVLIVEHGETRRLPDHAASREVDELLAPMLDVIPAQLAISSAAQSAGMNGFRYIQKIVTLL